MSTWFRSMDWGKNAPGCALWWQILADHHLHIRSEWKFQGLDAPEVATMILRRDRELGLKGKISYTAGDPSMFNETGQSHRAHGFVGESIAETLAFYGVPVIRGDNDRFNGWSRCHALLRLDEDGQPWMTVDPTCRYLIRSIASARSAKNDPDDVDTDSDDHALDAWRYGAMSRPLFHQAAVKPKIPAGSPADVMRKLREKTGRLFGRVA